MGRGGAEGTVGQVIAENKGCDKQDPHVFLTHGAFARAILLEHAVKVAVAQLSRLQLRPADTPAI